ncbi:MAG: hypothetical protein PHN60_00935 [Candidatus Gracilibacteria bacterium]|nr:hypothetical protein [Candidatus Gracilibacteria bacterium]
MGYLKEEYYYQDLYDHRVVDACRKIEKEYRDKPPEYVGKRLVTSNIDQFFIAQEASILGRDREKTIGWWMDSDRRKDELLKSTLIPKKVCCDKCGKPTRFFAKTIKTLIKEKLETHVLFVFRCDKCVKYKAIYDNGESIEYKIQKCPNCKADSEALYVELREHSFHVFIFCKNCRCHDEEEIDLSSSPKELDIEFEKDRARFCYSKEKAEKQFQWFVDLYEDIGRILDISEQKKKQKPLYDKFSQVKRMNVGILQKYLDEELSKEGYIGLKLEKPDTSTDIRVHFSVMDQTGEKDRYKITKIFRAKLKLLLENTNWEMANGERLQNRLGILSGQLRGIDSEYILMEKTKDIMRKNGEKMEL